MSLKKASQGGIILPELCQQPSYEGIVIAIGPKVMDIKKGDHVLWKRHFGVPFHNTDGLDPHMEYLLFTEEHIEAVFEEEDSA